MKKVISTVCLIFCSTISVIISAQNSKEPLGKQSGFYLGASYSSIRNPHFRPINEEISVHQASSTPGYLIGYKYCPKNLGLGIQTIYWKTAYDSFVFQDMASKSYITSTNPEFSHIAFDLYIEWIAKSKLYLGIYGLMGFGSSTEKYSLSGAAFPFEEWNGSKKLNEFDYSLGLGLKFSPIKWISAFSEIRWIPGALDYELEYLYQKNGYNYYQVLDTKTKNRATILSIGLEFNLRSFKNKSSEN